MAEELLMNELEAKTKALNEYKDKVEDLRVGPTDLQDQGLVTSA